MTPSEPSASAHATLSASPYAVNLQVFEGPLDLLLHLIRINEVEVTDIPIARVAEQYLEYLDVMRELDLDIAGEYLLMAATLAWIKSRMLLPVETDEEGEEIDPRAELVARLREYQRFKEAAGELGERRLLGRDVFDARSPGPTPPSDEDREAAGFPSSTSVWRARQLAAIRPSVSAAAFASSSKRAACLVTSDACSASVSGSRLQPQLSSSHSTPPASATATRSSARTAQGTTAEPRS